MRDLRQAWLRRLPLEVKRESMEGIGSLLVHGGEVGADNAEGVGPVLGSEGTGDFLFDLGHANGLFGQMIGERDMVVSGESPDIVGVEAQAQEQVGCLALSCPAAFARFPGERIDGITGRKDLVITCAVIGDPICRQRTTVIVHLMEAAISNSIMRPAHACFLPAGRTLSGLAQRFRLRFAQPIRGRACSNCGCSAPVAPPVQLPWLGAQ